MGIMVLTILAIFAQMERETILFRTYSGRVKTIQEKGRNPGIRVPYGYVRGNEPGTYKIVEEEAEIVRRIFREYISGDGRFVITYRLNEEGLPFRKDRPWNKSTVGKILCNHLYAGTLIWGKTKMNPKRHLEGEKWSTPRDNPIIKELSQDVLIPIISVEEFETAHRIRKSRDVFKHHKTSGRAFDSPNLLSGLVRCAKCGHSMYVHKKKDTIFTYYTCKGHLDKGKTFCDCEYIRQEEVEKKIVEEIKNRFLSGQTNLFEIISEQYENNVKSLKLAQFALETRLKQLDSEYAKVYKDYRKVDGGISAEDFNLIKDEIVKEQNEAKQKLTTANEELENLVSQGIDTSEIIAFAQSLNRWEELTYAEQKNLLFQWIDHIDMYKRTGRLEKNVDLIIHYKGILDTEEAM
jgi:hypothetical protein